MVELRSSKLEVRIFHCLLKFWQTIIANQMFHLFLLLDSSVSWQLFFQNAATPVMEGIINLHHDLMFFITFIFFFVLVVLVRTIYGYKFDIAKLHNESRFVVHGTAIEII